MKTNWLIPHRYKLWGWILLIPAAFLGSLYLFADFEPAFLEVRTFAIYSDGVHFFNDPTVGFGLVKTNLIDEISGVLFLLGALMVAFSKEKHEDEFIARPRLDALLWATYVNALLLIFCMLFFFDLIFLYVMIFNMFSVLVLFILRFRYLIYLSNKNHHEE